MKLHFLPVISQQQQMKNVVTRQEYIYLKHVLYNDMN